MIGLLLALTTGPAVVQEAAVQEVSASPLKVVNTAFIVSGLGAPFEGNVRVVVQNTGPEADELVAVSTPLGETFELRTDGNVFSDQPPVALPVALPAPGAEPSYLPLTVRVPGMARGDYWSTGTTVTLRFAHGGEMTVPVRQASPAPPSR